MTTWTDPTPLRFDADLSSIEHRPGVYRIRSRKLGWYYVGCATGAQKPGSLNRRLQHYRNGQHGGGLVEKIIEETLFDGYLHDFHRSWRPDPSNKNRKIGQFRRDAITYLDLEVSVAYTDDGLAARELEDAEMTRLTGLGEWLINRKQPKVELGVAA